MAKVYEFVANGFEEIEGLAPVDILRRGGVDIKTVSVTGSEFVESSHGVTIKADIKFEDADLRDADRASRSISTLRPPIRARCFRKTATSSRAKDRPPHCPTPIASCAISSTKHGCGSWRRACSTPI